MTISYILLAYTFFLLGVTVISFVYWKMRERAFRWELSRSRLMRCKACNRVFLGRRQELVSHCPRCHGVSTDYLQNVSSSYER